MSSPAFMAFDCAPVAMITHLLSVIHTPLLLLGIVVMDRALEVVVAATSVVTTLLGLADDILAEAVKVEVMQPDHAYCAAQPTRIASQRVALLSLGFCEFVRAQSKAPKRSGHASFPHSHIPSSTSHFIFSTQPTYRTFLPWFIIAKVSKPGRIHPLEPSWPQRTTPRTPLRHQTSRHTPRSDAAIDQACKPATWHSYHERSGLFSRHRHLAARGSVPIRQSPIAHFQHVWAGFRLVGAQSRRGRW